MSKFIVFDIHLKLVKQFIHVFIPCLEKYSQSEAKITIDCIFCGMQRVICNGEYVFHSTFPSFLALNSLLGSI